jgi:sortase A
METILYQALPTGRQAKKTKQAKAFFLKLPKKESLANSPIKRSLKWLGSGLILTSFALSFLTLGPAIKQEYTYRFNFRFSHPHSLPSTTSLTEEVTQEKLRHQAAEEASAYGVPTDFSIVIPKISAASAVVANVNPADEKEYKKRLKEGVAHAAGTKFPGNPGVIYLFAHSALSPVDIANYNAVFYLLKELKAEDEIIIFFAGQKYRYKVNQTLVTTADETDWLTEPRNEEVLVLQTCWPPGTSLKRLLVIAKPA